MTRRHLLLGLAALSLILPLAAFSVPDEGPVIGNSILWRTDGELDLERVQAAGDRAFTSSAVMGLDDTVWLVGSGEHLIAVQVFEGNRFDDPDAVAEGLGHKKRHLVLDHDGGIRVTHVGDFSNEAVARDVDLLTAELLDEHAWGVASHHRRLVDLVDAETADHLRSDQPVRAFGRPPR